MAGKSVECECYLFYESVNEANGKQRKIQRGIKPVYQTKESACADVAIPFETVIPAGKSVKIDLWIGFEIREGYKIVMYPRSSLLIKKGLIQPVSIIDSDYSGQHVHAPIYNPGKEDVVLEAGERVAQIECVPAYDCKDWERKKEQRGEGGFGSTGAV